MGATLIAAGVLSVTGIGTEYTIREWLTTVADQKRFDAYIDVSNMQSADTIIISIYVRVQTGGSYQLYDQETISGVQSSPILYIPPLPNDNGLKITIKQTAGSVRSYPYRIYSQEAEGTTTNTNALVEFLDDLADVTITPAGPLNNDILRFDGSTGQWINAQVVGGGSGGITASSVDTLTNKDLTSTTNVFRAWANADISATAAIVYSKLTLASSIVNADIAAAAAIAYSKLNLAGSLVNADVSASAAIAYSKLNLATSIVNADIATAAAISWTKISKAGSVLADLGNIILTSPANGQALVFNGTNWVNQTVTGSGDVTLAGTQTFTGAKTFNAGTLILAAYIDFTRTTTPANPAANMGRAYVKQVDTNNDGLFVLLKKAGAYVEVQIA